MDRGRGGGPKSVRKEIFDTCKELIRVKGGRTITGRNAGFILLGKF